MQEFKTGGTLRFDVPKLAELQLYKKVRSPRYPIANRSWFLDVWHNVECLGIFAYCNTSNEDSDRRFDAEVRFRILPQKAGKVPYGAEGRPTADRCLHGWGTSMFMKWADILNPENGYIREDGGIVVEVTIAVTKVAVRETACDFSTPQPNISLVTLIIGERRLHVSKEYLAVFSPVFKAMFYGDFDEKNKDEIPLEDLDHDEFVELLHVIYPSRKPVTVDNVEILLRLADHYNIQFVMRECEQLLCGDCEIPLEKKLLWADRYRLARLQFASLNSIKTVDEVKMLKSTAEFGGFSLQMRDALFERILMID